MWKKLALFGSILVSLCFGIGIDFYHILALLLILSKRQIVRVAVGLQGDALRRGIAISQHLLLGKNGIKGPEEKRGASLPVQNRWGWEGRCPGLFCTDSTFLIIQLQANESSYVRYRVHKNYEILP